jgi:hypothetical protein
MYYPGYFYPPRIVFQFQYTPIIINVVPSVLLVDIQKNEIDPRPKKNQYIKIISPTSKLPGNKQSLQNTTIFPIPNNGVLKFKLLPSHLYTPYGDYNVYIQDSYHARLHNEHMTWRVPVCPIHMKATIVHTDDPNGDLIPYNNIYEIASCSRSGDYHLDNNYIIWDTNTPQIGETYQITYQPGVSLRELCYLGNNNVK